MRRDEGRRRRRASTVTPAPAAASSRGISLSGSIEATTGRPAARLEYVLDGTLTSPSPARSGTTWMSPVASTSDEAFDGLVAGEADVGQRPPPALEQRASCGTVTVDEERDIGQSGAPLRPRARATARNRHCRRTARPARRRSPAPPDSAVIRGAGRITSVSTKFGITCTASTVVAAELGDLTLRAQVVAEHRDRRRPAIGEPLEPARDTRSRAGR